MFSIPLKLTFLVICISAALADKQDTDKHRHVESDFEKCDGHHKTQEMLDLLPDYKIKHELEQKRAHEFVARMRKNKDRSFKKDLYKLGAYNESPKMKKRNLLYSEYDDEIDTEPVIVIPIVFHVLYSDSDENLSDEQLQSQLDVLNKDFRALNDEIVNGKVANIWDDRVGDAKIEFYINETNRVDISSLGSASVCYDQSIMKFSSNGGSDAKDPKYFLNIWLCDISSQALGYAYQPCLLDTSGELYDGVVLDVGVVGSTADDDDGDFFFRYSGVYDEGRTLTHEVGHYLNLNHIWGDATTDSCSESDDVSDTPTSYEANYGCPNGTNSCTSTDPETGTDLRDMYENYMDYTNDACLYIFTEEQVWRMRAVLSGDGCRKEMYYAGAILEANQTLQPSSQRTTSVNSNSFTCDDGCELAEDFVNDNYCDCSECEDEDSWTCDTCSAGCPGTSTYCFSTSLCTSTDGFTCNDGCEITATLINDNFCDCSECEDEESWTCDTCLGGCSGTSTDCHTLDYCSSAFTFYVMNIIGFNLIVGITMATFAL